MLRRPLSFEDKRLVSPPPSRLSLLTLILALLPPHHLHFKSNCIPTQPNTNIAIAIAASIIGKMASDNLRTLVVTGTRADWSKLQPVCRAFIRVLGKIDVFITGMHLEEAYGYTANLVRQLEGVDQFHMHKNQTLGPHQTEVMEETIKGLAKVLRDRKITDVVVHGDRVEACTAAMVARQHGIRLHHIEGGELSGSIDESYRHAVTAFTTYSYVCSASAKDLVVKNLGQHPQTVFNIGSPEMDAHARDYGVSLNDVKRKYGIPFAGEYGIVSFHSVTSELDGMHEQAAYLFATLEEYGKNFIVIMPNNDPGTDAIRDIIGKILEGKRSDRFFQSANIDFEHFSVLQKNASVFIGNSSAGVREMPFHGVGSINVGSRQNNRVPDIPAIINAPANDAAALLRALKSFWGKKFARDKTFGDGTAEEKLVGALKTPGHFDRSVQKSFYLPG
ncbi:UDP-N-acetylglucosamine 2-epimerase [Notoacmeibacter ruber]|uniref:UDP-N-acetylglucosamine 2-epimerase (Hydrolyzing) n=1 Tax=Notoacmeibacter ruber TaxID=2670375 RepID=A0A3L7J3T9_9HYPH|nr:UDP-N-acetylglucosamine 2-epimerase [Notoacmeibacter ruber]RLQ85227.1 UDP-N-acetylglucosamine 2-epimerase (hydrolyzing) [Notoacmeibacter ruber]